MRTWRWRAWTTQYLVPGLLLLGSLAIMFVFFDDPDMVWIFVVAPLVALVTAAITRPERPWVTPLAVALVLATAIVIGDLLGIVDPRGSALMAYPYTVTYMGLPLTVATWLGTGLGDVLREIRSHPPTPPPASPAGPGA